MRKEFHELANAFPVIKEIRGVGLMNAFSFDERIMPSQIISIQNELYQQGFIIVTKPLKHTIRFYPPLIITKAEIDLMISALSMSINKTIN